MCCILCLLRRMSDLFIFIRCAFHPAAGFNGAGGSCGILGQASTTNAKYRIGDAGSEMGNNLVAANALLGAGRTVVSVAGSYESMCAVLDNAAIKCWGSNTIGELGTGDKTSRPGTTNISLVEVDLGSGRTAK